jgi:hypothetical protein
MRLLVTRYTAIEAALVVAGYKILGAHFMFILRKIGLIPFMKCPVGP